MKKTRRIALLLAVLCTVGCWSACGRTAPETPDETEPESVMESATETETETEIETEPVTEAATETEPATEAATETEPATEAATETEPATEAVTETEPVTEAATETEPVTEAVTETEPATEAETAPKPEEITMQAQQWLANEITFTANQEYKTPVYNENFDVVFTNTTTGTTFTMPGFWDGGTTWKVRFALTELGDWTFTTVFSEESDTGLHGISGKVTCTAYTGDLAIYQHGFLRTEEGKRYFMYADGTPFFYLGDTHWTLPMESIDGIGDIPKSLAEEKGITSQFKHIIDYRTEQGYNVIQSQPLATYNGNTGNSWFGTGSASIWTLGVNEEMLKKFQQFDQYFAYIAEKGLVHANSQLSFPEELIELGRAAKADRVEKLCRYWVARYAAYPVLWTTTQEGDNDYYGYKNCTAKSNPWIPVMDYVAKYDPYDHPSTCHQENYGETKVNNSAFKDSENHKWYAAQIFFEDWIAHGRTMEFSRIREYWTAKEIKPVINYESKYDHYQTGDLGSRAHAWLSMLNGCSGYAYGVQPIWSLFWAKNIDKDKVNNGVETYETRWNWVEGLYADGGKQVAGMKDFLEDYEWWNLAPAFGGNEYYKPTGTNYSVATVENRLYVGYFYSNRAASRSHGTFKGMENGQYEVVWFNCVTCEKTEPEIITVTNGTWEIPAKPDKNDWAVAVRLIEG